MPHTRRRLRNACCGGSCRLVGACHECDRSSRRAPDREMCAPVRALLPQRQPPTRLLTLLQLLLLLLLLLALALVLGAHSAERDGGAQSGGMWPAGEAWCWMRGCLQGRFQGCACV